MSYSRREIGFIKLIKCNYDYEGGIKAGSGHALIEADIHTWMKGAWPQHDSPREWNCKKCVL